MIMQNSNIKSGDAAMFFIDKRQTRVVFGRVAGYIGNKAIFYNRSSKKPVGLVDQSRIVVANKENLPPHLQYLWEKFEHVLSLIPQISINDTIVNLPEDFRDAILDVTDEHHMNLSNKQIQRTMYILTQECISREIIRKLGLSKDINKQPETV